MSKRPWVETATIDPPPPPKEIHFDPTTVVADDGVDEEDLDADGAQPAASSVPPCLSLKSMMETFMTTQTAHEQLLDELLTKVAALTIDFDEYRSALPPPLPLDSWVLPLIKKGEKDGVGSCT